MRRSHGPSYPVCAGKTNSGFRLAMQGETTSRRVENDQRPGGGATASMAAVAARWFATI